MSEEDPAACVPETVDGEARTVTARLVLVWRVAAESGRLVWWTPFLLLRHLAYARRGDPAVRRAVLLKEYLLHLGPLYIKAGQILGTQTGVLPKRAIDEFRSFFAELPPMREAALRRVLRHHLGRPVEEVFASFDWRPVAVGSVAQVHRAVLRDGDDDGGGTVVAVKVVKSGVRERLAASSWVLRAVLYAGHVMVPRLRAHDLPGHFAELRPVLVGQCDMRREASRQEEVARNFRNHPYLRVPRAHHALCGRDVLVMEYVTGRPGHDAPSAGVPRAVLAARLQHAFLCMVYLHGLFHVDPHPGNIVFGDDGRVVLVDFGLVGRLSADDQWNLSAFYYACVRRQWALGARRFTRTFVVHPERIETDRHGYETALAAILREHFRERADRWSTIAFLDDAIRLLRRYRTRISLRFTLLCLCLLTGEGFIAQVDPDIDIWRNARRFTDRFSPYLDERVEERFRRELGTRMPACLRARRTAAGVLVAPTHFDRFVLPSAFPITVAEASGSRIRDIDGNEYIDLSCGYGPHILGYGHPAVVRAIEDAARRGAVNAFGNPGELLLAERITAAFPPGSKVVLCNSGTEAVQMAVRIARARTGRQRVAKFEGHFNGFSDQGMVSSWFRHSGDRTAPDPVANSAGTQRSVVADTLVLQYGEPVSLDRIRAHARSLACVVIEPMPAAIADFDAAFLQELSEVCVREGVLVVYDEVVTGFRVHYGGVQHLAGVRPDLTCLGKIIGGGLPCGAVVGRPEIIDMARTTGDPFLDVEGRAFVGGTMSGNSVTAAAGAAVLTHLAADRDIYQRLRDRTERLIRRLRAHAAEQGIPCAVRGRDSIFSVTFDHAMPWLVRDRFTGSNFAANIALSYYLRRYGVYLPESHTMMLSDAHSDNDLKLVGEAFGDATRDMVEDGFFDAD